MLDVRAVAVQGVGYRSLALALQGFVSAAVGGGSSDRKRRRLFVIRKDGKELYFNDEAEALEALDVEPIANPTRRRRAEMRRQLREMGVQVVPLHAVQAWADVAGLIDQYNAAYQSREFARILALFEQMQDEEDVEMLLLSL